MRKIGYARFPPPTGVKYYELSKVKRYGLKGDYKVSVPNRG